MDRGSIPRGSTRGGSVELLRLREDQHFPQSMPVDERVNDVFVLQRLSVVVGVGCHNDPAYLTYIDRVAQVVPHTL